MLSPTGMNVREHGQEHLDLFSSHANRYEWGWATAFGSIFKLQSEWARASVLCITPDDQKKCGAACWSVVQCVAACVAMCCSVCCSVFCITSDDKKECGAVCFSVLRCVAVCCSVLQCVAVCCSVLQCVLQ